MEFRSYSQRQQFHTGDVPPLLEDQLINVNWKTCLELGCGDGSLLRALEEKGIIDGKLVMASDLSPDRIRVVNSMTVIPDCTVGDACNIALKDESIDFLITSQVIEHVIDDGLMSDEMYRVLANDGVAYIGTVFKKWYGWYFYRCNGKWTLDPTHIREYNRESDLLDKLAHSGFKVIENRKTLDGRPIMDSLLRRFGAGRDIYSHKSLRFLRSIKMPIPGYYIWELLCKKC